MSDKNTKPGYKTTEFWATVVYGLAALLNGSGLLKGYTIDLETVYAAGQAVMVYVGSRSGTKALSAYVTARSKPLDPGKLNN